jgi:uncharacterized membrane protein
MVPTGEKAAEGRAPADLVERERELADLSRLVEATIAGEGRMALIGGGVGVLGGGGGGGQDQAAG